MRAFLRRWWPLLLVAVGILAAFAVQSATPFIAYLLPFVMAAAVSITLVVALIVGLLRKEDRSRLILLLCALLIGTGFGVFCFKGGPLWLRFSFSRDQLHDAAMLAVQGKPPATPIRIGAFDVRDIAVEGGVVSLRIYGDRFDDQGIAFFPGPLPDLETEAVSYYPLGWERGCWYLYDRTAGGI